MACTLPSMKVMSDASSGSRTRHEASSVTSGNVLMRTTRESWRGCDEEVDVDRARIATCNKPVSGETAIAVGSYPGGTMRCGSMRGKKSPMATSM